LSTSSRRRAPVGRVAPAILATNPSATLRERLLGELSALASSDEAAVWAHQSLPAKNTLTVADAKLVEDGFRSTLAAWEQAQPQAPPVGPQSPDPAIVTAPTAHEPSPTRPGSGRRG